MRRISRMKKPMIGIVPLVDIGRDSYWMLPGYMKGVEGAGGIPVMLPLTSDREGLMQMAGTFDGFLFTGGHDVSPAVYGQAVSEKCEDCCRERDEMEEILFGLVRAQDRPVLGICRGLQLINAVMGGTLYQDLPSEHPSDVKHRQSPPYDVPCHSVTLVEGTPLHGLLKVDRLMVNSCHHQAVRELAPGLKPMAVSGDGLVEALYVQEKPYIWAVQWHPEFSYLSDGNSRKIFKWFVDSCSK